MEKSLCRIEAFGMINALGSDCSEIFKRLTAGDQLGMQKRGDLIPDMEIPVGAVSASLPAVTAELEEYQSRNSALLLSAYFQIESIVRSAIEEFGSDRVAVILGTSTSGIASGEEALSHRLQAGKFPDDYDYAAQELGAVAEALAKFIGVDGIAYTISTACSSSTKVFGAGRRLLQQGLCDAVIVGGADSLCRLTLNGFHSLELVSDELTNPMSANRKGINIGEGAALCVLTKESGGIQLKGVGESSDAYHISAPHPDGRGAYNSMNAALRDAGLKSDEIDYINLHATGTKHNDAMESKAIDSLFGRPVPCSGSKPQIGHLLGASGANEIGFCWLALENYQKTGQMILPPHCFDGAYDPEIVELNLVTKGLSIELASDSCNFLSNSFAFGGSNCSVVLGVG